MGVSVLLDTHALLWALLEPRRLSRKGRNMLADPETIVLVSSATAWEIATKTRLGKLDDARAVLANYTEHLRTMRATEVPITSEHAVLAGSFDVPHRDPFDRMIAAHATLLGVPVLTKDPAFAIFPCQCLW